PPTTRRESIFGGLRDSLRALQVCRQPGRDARGGREVASRRWSIAMIWCLTPAGLASRAIDRRSRVLPAARREFGGDALLASVRVRFARVAEGRSECPSPGDCESRAACRRTWRSPTPWLLSSQKT